MGNSIFGGDDNKDNFKSAVDNQTKSILTIIQRQKDLESSIDILSQKIELLTNNSFNTNKTFFKDIKIIKEDHFGTKLGVKKLNEFNQKLKSQVRLFATKDDTNKLEKYIDLWDPLNFITRDEKDKIKEEIKKEMREEMSKIIEDFLK